MMLWHCKITAQFNSLDPLNSNEWKLEVRDFDHSCHSCPFEAVEGHHCSNRAGFGLELVLHLAFFDSLVDGSCSAKKKRRRSKLRLRLAIASRMARLTLSKSPT